MTLKVRHDHQEEGVGADTPEVWVVQPASFEELLQHQDQGLYDLILCQIILDKLHALQAVVVVSHLRYVNIEGLLEEYLVFLIVDVLEKIVGIPMLVCQQVIDVAVDLHHRHGGIINVLNLAYPLVLKLLL